MMECQRSRAHFGWRIGQCAIGVRGVREGEDKHRNGQTVHGNDSVNKAISHVPSAAAIRFLRMAIHAFWRPHTPNERITAS